jgi:membrane protease YdiL (CAAX protease family)
MVRAKRVEEVDARRSLIVFAVLLVPLTALADWLVWRTGKNLSQISPLYILALMWSPFVASLAARLVSREGLFDVSFRWGGRLGWVCVGRAFAFPLLVGFLAYGVAWLSGLASFEPPPVAKFPWMPWASGRFVVRLFLNGALGTAFGSLFAAGEELGWRGYLLVRMRDAGLPRPVLLGGVVWGLWHVPLIVTGQYTVGANVALAVPVFCLDIVAASYLFAYVRLRSGSVWPAVLAHAAWNAVIQGVFDRSTHGESVWVGEAGILTAVAGVVVALWLVRKPFSPQRAPGQPEAQIRILSL